MLTSGARKSEDLTPDKTDAKDAVHLARLLRLDEFTAVAVPTIEQASARDLVRTVCASLKWPHLEP